MSKQMRAVIFEGSGKVEIKSIPVPEVRKEDDVLVKVERASICGSDIQILKVPPGHPSKEGIVLGHEYVGKIVEKGESVDTFALGDRVVVEPAITCGTCIFCRAGAPNMCRSSTTLGIYLDGGFAEYSLVPERCLHRVRSDIAAEVAVFTEPLSCIVHALDRLKGAAGETALVLGAGPIGLLLVKMLKASGMGKILVSQTSILRREFAKKCGASIVLDPAADDLQKQVYAISPIGVDIVADCVGKLLDVSLKCVRNGGRILLFGLDSEAENAVKPFDITHRELTIIGSFVAQYTFPSAIKILENGVIDVTDIITHRFSLEDFKKGLEVIRAGKAIKVIIEF